MGLWVRFLHMLQKVKDVVDAGADPVITLGLGLSIWRVDLPGGKWGQLSMVTISGLAHLHLLCSPGKVQGLLFEC